MTNFLFWNLDKVETADEPVRATAICQSLTRLTQNRKLDVVIFAEYEFQDADVETALNAAGIGPFHRPASRSKRIAIWTRWPRGAIVDRYRGRVASKLTIRELRPPIGLPAHLVSVHCRDRLTLTTPEGRGHAVIELNQEIRKFETRNGIGRTLLVGDLNLNPFEFGTVGPACFHAMMTADLARSASGLKSRVEYSTFYNPMWALFGDRTPGPPGTYYWKNSEEATNHFWHMYDQVLVRPELIDSLHGVEILAGDGVDSFLTRDGRPRVSRYSDHLPIYFELDFTR